MMRSGSLRSASRLEGGTSALAKNLTVQLAQPVSGLWLAAFRIAFGLTMLWNVGQYFGHGLIALQWISPQYHFTYLWFQWLRPLPAIGMYGLFVVLACLAVLISIGWHTRAAAAVFAIIYTYQFLLDTALYLNHYYAACLFASLLAVVPAGARWSVDEASSRRRTGRVTVPRWTLWLLRFQVGAIYLFGGVAKLTSDWLHGEPLGIWLYMRSDLPIVAAALRNGVGPTPLSYGSACFDILIVPALLCRRTRAPAFVAVAGFHIFNARFFNIGIFPWLMIGATTVFLSPEWPARLRGIVTRRGREAPTASSPVLQPLPAWGIGVLVAYCCIQIAVPLRHVLYPGNVAWTNEGYMFSWRMMTNYKVGVVRFRVVTPSGAVIVDPALILTPWQVQSMVGDPDEILQFGRTLAAERERDGERSVAVFADASLSLNGRPPAVLVDPTRSLAGERRELGHATWITPVPQRVGGQ